MSSTIASCQSFNHTQTSAIARMTFAMAAQEISKMERVVPRSAMPAVMQGQVQASPPQGRRYVLITN